MALMAASLRRRGPGVRPQRLVHHRERVRGHRVPVRNTASSTRSPGRSPQRRRWDHEVRLDGMVTMPPWSGGDHHASGGGQGQPVSGLPAQRASHGPVGDPARLVHPANPYTTSSRTAGTSGAAATGRREP